MSKSHILKGALRPAVDAYDLPEAESLAVEEVPAPSPPPAEAAPDGAPPPRSAPKPPPVPDPRTPVDYARLQAEAILEDARRQAEELREQLRLEAEEELAALRDAAREEGYRQGYTEGLAGAVEESRLRQEQRAAELAELVRAFLEEASQAREALLEQSVEELKDLALAVAEKVIRISLKSSADILVRMIRAATEKHKRREWVRIYIAGCDAKGLAHISPELTAALAPLTDRVRVIPIADDESGTCIIEMPDEIIDASVSTQLSNIRDVLSAAPGEDAGAL